MILEKDLKKLIEEQKINCFSVRENSFIEESMLLLNSNDIKEFLRFLTINNITNVFYKYTFYNKEDYIINDIFAEMSDKDVYNLIKNDIESYNEEIKSLDFSKPKSLQAFCLYDTEYIGILFNDPWIEQRGIVTWQDKVKELLREHENELEARKQNSKVKNEKLKEDFKNYLLNDKGFQKCTNIKMRKQYILSKINNNELDHYMGAFLCKNSITNTMRLDHDELSFIIEMAWKELKE